MAFVFNIAKGRIRELAADHPNDFRALLLGVADTDDAMGDTATITALLATAAGEAAFTNYARETLAGVLGSVDNAANDTQVDCNDIVYTAAGGALNDTTTHVVIYYDPAGAGNDANSIPLVCIECVFTTNGQDVTLQINADGFWGAA